MMVDMDHFNVGKILDELQACEISVKFIVIDNIMCLMTFKMECAFDNFCV